MTSAVPRPGRARGAPRTPRASTGTSRLPMMTRGPRRRPGRRCRRAGLPTASLGAPAAGGADDPLAVQLPVHLLGRRQRHARAPRPRRAGRRGSRRGGTPRRGGARRRGRPPRRRKTRRCSGAAATGPGGSARGTPRAQVIHRSLAWERTICRPECRMPRFPVHAPRSGIATMSPVGVTRLRSGAFTRSAALRSAIGTVRPLVPRSSFVIDPPACAGRPACGAPLTSCAEGLTFPG